MKRDVMEGERAEDARRKISRAQGRASRAKADKDEETDETVKVTPMSPAQATQPPVAQAGNSDVCAAA